MDRLHSMRVFARVIDEGSFASAARALNQSAAAVTRLVADLEEHLGVRLINRTTRRLALTDVGELYLERVRRILADVDEAEALASVAMSEPRGHVRVLSPPAFTVHQIAKHLPRFRELYPLVTVELVSTGPVESVDENFDISLLQLGRQPLEGDFVARLLAHSEVITCASPAYLDQRGRPVHPNDLFQHEAMLPNFLREISFVHTATGETVTLVPPRPALSTIHTDTMYAAALAGMGLAGLPSYVVEDAIYEEALERVLPEWQVLTVRLYAAIPTRKYVPARTRAFLNFLLETFGGTENDPWLSPQGETPRRALDRARPQDPPIRRFR